MLSIWIENQRALLRLELNEEIEQLKQKINQLSAKECERQGLSLLRLSIVDSKNSLFGRFSIILESNRIKNKVIDRVCFKIGDEVVLYSEKKPSTVTQCTNNTETFNQQATVINGIVSKISNEIIEIITEESPEEVYLSPPLRLDLRSNEYTHKKMMDLLNELELTYHNRNMGHHLIPLLFGEIDVSPASLKCNISESCDVLMNQALNHSQVEAIRGSLDSAYVSLIHGPPGTGKTSTVTELIFQLVRLGKKVLVCAPSNIAVDNILEKIATSMDCPNPIFINQTMTGLGNEGVILPTCLRLGHPARLSDSILKFCLDSQIANHEGTEITSDIRDEINDYRKKLSSNKKGSRSTKAGVGDVAPSSYKEIRKEIKLLQKDLRKRETDIVRNIIKKKNVILCTNIGAGSKLLRGTDFDVTIIDECAQGLEASCWIPILRGSKCILAGDHLQLPPTIKCKEAEQNGLGVTLFERLIYHKQKLYESVTYLLNTQYRMNHKICSWASEYMYRGLLQSHESVRNHTLDDFNLTLGADLKIQSNPMGDVAIPDEVTPPQLSLPVMLVIDTAGSAPEDTDVELGNKAGSTSSGTTSSVASVSHCNMREAYLVLRYVKMLIRAGIKCKNIGIITPYSNQVQLLKKLFFSEKMGSRNLDSDSEIDTKPKNNSNQAETVLYENPIHSDDESYGNFCYNFDNLEIKTVDGFQGGEKEVIVLSLVRSNSPQREVGFLSDRRRMNVAVTRAKRHIAVICDVNTCSSDSFMRTLLEHIAIHGDSRYAEEFVYMTDEELFSADYIDNTETDQNAILAEESKTTKNNDNDELKQDKLNIIEDVVLGLVSLKAEETSNLKAFKLGNSAIQFFDYSYSTDNYTSIISDKLSSTIKNAQGQLVIRFPTCLNSHDRLVVHEKCDLHGLYHRSKDTRNGKKRYVEISLKPFNNEPPPAPAATFLSAAVDIANSKPSLSAEPIVPELAIIANIQQDEGDLDLGLEADSPKETEMAVVCQPGKPKKSKSKPKKNQQPESTKPANSLAHSDWLSTDNKPSNKVNHTVGGIASRDMKNISYYVGEERKKAMMDADALVRGLDMNAFDDDDALLNAAIQTNHLAASINKYRISSTPMPNNEKVKNQAKLKDAILDAKKIRQSEHIKQQQELAQIATSNRTVNKKVVKKPTSEEMRKIREANSSTK